MNCIRPQRGFNKNIIEELKIKIQEIQENLVWDKHNGELFGYVDFGELNLASFEKPSTVATHVRVIMVCSIVNPLKFFFGKFYYNNYNFRSTLHTFLEKLGSWS